MFSNVRFLTMEEIIFAALNAKKKNLKKPRENHFIPDNGLFYTQKLKTHPINLHQPILPIKLKLARKVTLL